MLFAVRAQLREAIFAFREQEKEFRQEIESMEMELEDTKKREARYAVMHYGTDDHIGYVNDTFTPFIDLITSLIC